MFNLQNILIILCVLLFLAVLGSVHSLMKIREKCEEYISKNKNSNWKGHLEAVELAKEILKFIS